MSDYKRNLTWFCDWGNKVKSKIISKTVDNIVFKSVLWFGNECKKEVKKKCLEVFKKFPCLKK